MRSNEIGIYRLSQIPLGVLVVALLAHDVSAQGGPVVINACPTSPITSDVVLGSSFVASQSPCIVVGADGVSVSLDGFTIDMRNFGLPGGFEPVAVDTNGRSNLLIQGPGTVLTFSQLQAFFRGAIHVDGGDAIDIQQVEVRNQDFTGSCPPLAQRTSTGISVVGGTGVTITHSLVECHARGIWILNGTAAAGISGVLHANTVRENRSTAAGLTFGIFLDGSSRWMIRQNLLTANGNSLSPSQSALQLGTLLGTSPSSANQVIGNTADNNQGTGIRIFDFLFNPFVSTRNLIIGNHATGNVASDLADTSNSGANRWLRNNSCHTEEGLVPAEVCNSGE